MGRTAGQRTIYCEVTMTTDDAVLVDHQDEEFWVPRSVCLDGQSIEEGDSDLVVADWWLRDRGIF